MAFSVSLAMYPRRLLVPTAQPQTAWPTKIWMKSPTFMNATSFCVSLSLLYSVYGRCQDAEKKKVVSGQAVLEARSTIGILGAGLAKNDRFRGRRSRDDWAPGHICLDGG